MRETGTVIKKESRHIWVKADNQSACESCSQAWICRTDRRDGLIRIPDTLNLNPGDRVVFTLSERTLARATIALYGIPLIFFVFGALLAYLLADSLGYPADPGAAFGGFASLALSYGVVKVLLGRLIRRAGSPVTLVEVVGRKSGN